MTDLKKPVRRRTIGLHRGRRIMVSLEPGDMLAVIDYGYSRYPAGYDFRITTLDFTRGELQARTRRRPLRTQINPGWFHIGYCDDILRENS